MTAGTRNIKKSCGTTPGWHISVSTQRTCQSAWRLITERPLRRSYSIFFTNSLGNPFDAIWLTLLPLSNVRLATIIALLSFLNSFKSFLLSYR